MNSPNASLAGQENYALGQIHHNTPPSNKPPRPFIDKVSLTMDVLGEDHQKHIFGQIIDLPNDTTTGWISGTKGAYRGAVRIHPVGKATSATASPFASDYMLVQVHPRNGQGGFLRAEWNPARFNDNQMANIFKQFDDNLDLPWFRFWDAKVTRLDIAVDLPGVQVRDFVFDRKRSPIRHCIFRAGCLETIYLGKRARGQARVYDKQAQLGGSGSTLTRIEIATVPNRIARNLYDLTNPFHSLQVFDLKKADLKLGTPLTQALHRALRSEGLRALDSIFPPLAAKENAKRIKASTPSFWAPEALWVHWPAALEAALPPKGKPKSSYGGYTKPGPAANAA